MNTDIITNIEDIVAETTEQVADEAMSFGERLVFGGEVTLIGILIVFSVLAALWGVLILFKKFFYDIPEKKKAAQAAAAPTAVPAPVPSEPAVAEAEDDTQLIAVITAAIAAYNSDKGAGALPFRVVSYKRVRGANGWNGADENETI